ncbi:MAG: Histidyl-tRNA synthetase [Candidatus Yanofskybacteria bacterium GW2011_GWF1_44_227]|uniref:Histidine--tRNA ligase n=1 Tax=Candidatus Yanofskybacteria bacterium GW2011_GWE2_40_11 TaxID=1619033 RepID=A0A0G0TS74_9BACT|nr:MAG: Histidyl-tRNA synthetase [Candidatus Yanofskybacteria bacterium GW2011_GWE1_40_10]KKR40702.1 MAG: Histidyl-tRNA synthetase [Candidatus Yanofskybacteria bacterium GW2011_GWE2_40_11]KKT15588.1 MAG: Histidyl-tRNA synthetase [Candidatus Yanofskybacteria bacterium GW2011_GWF2_43_596]KKT53362.1 MAG: Histidyl-tRNA synthetase [Candidatus Yanofskybacteria bacterium GW2011_GWF1_44_227]OGN36108.1 MAG: histidine--tRNA ligase [Candidatus Yanofskybacteria bacterium RIFOXYA1_FULL_44_17]OGN36567.1 MAG
MTTDKQATIDPQLASGFKDYLPEDMIPRQKMFDSIRTVFERWGFVPLDTPGLEREEIITGGDPNFKMNIFRVRLNEGDDKYALRFDLTVPLARVVAAYPDIKKPFKRYQTGKVWRGERPQAGRYREFVQFDADTVGSASMLADAEIVAIMCETMPALGIENFLVRVNNRKILNGLAQYAGFDMNKISAVLRAIDKLDKQGWDKVSVELAGEKIGLNQDQIAAIKKFIDLKVEGQIETLNAVQELMVNSPIAMQGISELREIAGYLNAMAVPTDKWKIDLSVARGLGYYTGPVFETVLTDLLEIGSVFSGGRYDGLVQKFSTASVPATGASVGVDRLFAAMTKLGLITQSRTVSDVIVLNFDKSVQDLCLATAAIVRSSGIKTEIFIDGDKKMRDQLGYVSDKGIPLVVIIGPEEVSKNVVQLKDMRSGKQEEIPLDSLVERIKELI